LPPNPKGYPSTRASDDHLARIESVVRFYKQKTAKPIILMGHSNGAVSVTEYLRYMNANKSRNLIQGLILSSSRNGAYIDEPMSVRTIILHHKDDGCPISTAAFSDELYKTISGFNKLKTEFKILKTGEADSGNPCSSGFHMYNGASDEAAKAIEAFALKN
jgi:surfactin synthase thioesterase subunit